MALETPLLTPDEIPEVATGKFAEVELPVLVAVKTPVDRSEESVSPGLLDVGVGGAVPPLG